MDDILLQLPRGIALRGLRHSDAPSLARHATSKEVWDNLRNRMAHPYTEADATTWINFTLDTSNHVRSGKWTPEHGSEGPALLTGYAITIDDEVVGSIGPKFGDDIYIRTAEIGYWLGVEHWGKGVMTSVVPAFLAWAWETFGILVRVNAETYESNAASGKVLQKAGFKFEGRQPDMCYKNGVVGAALMWGALRPR
ncbi:hypothetical protein LTR08_001778 [Meristemomyces frigidus]|nr:hypothetical protein LTR08_001778 [Meristemomyces frigidus]